MDADEEDQLAAAIQASLAESQPSSSDQKKAKSSYQDENSDSDIDLISGDDSNMSTPAKRRSKANSPERSKKNGESNSNGDHNGQSNGDAKTEEDNEWMEYLGKEQEDEKSSILIRFPDGKRENKCIPASSKLKVSFHHYRFCDVQWNLC